MVLNALKHGFWLLMAIGILSGCMTPPPPRDLDNLCNIFRQYPQWSADAHYVAHKWYVPVSVQMAIVHQESKFDAHARPPRRRLLWIIPWTRPTSAYGYSQALKGTWALYKKSHGRLFASRDHFGDAVDFIGWYANEAYKKAHIPKYDAYRLYLAYHEGIGGYQRKTYLRKPWLIAVAHKVAARAHRYQTQLAYCHL